MTHREARHAILFGGFLQSVEEEEIGKNRLIWMLPDIGVPPKWIVYNGNSY